MSKVPDLKSLFIVVAVVEALYAVIALLTPPDFVQTLTGWVLSADGQWIVKLLGAALGFQASIAWIFRKEPHLGVAWMLAGYQILAATVDWVMWLWLSGSGIFATPLAQMTVSTSIVLHYALGILLIVAINKTKKQL